VFGLLTLGSLFSGSGGFELGGILSGIEPIWASEIEPFAIRVTTKRLPGVAHLGDINKIDGGKVPPTDIITGGFCCQDLSVAGKRAGLHGKRSGLFFQVIRIIKQMRVATDNKYPRFVVLENVPGMYSSTKGLDFQEVLNALIQTTDETLTVPLPATMSI
jgi:DNA (cytosine-5)-methyltransferase 1